MSSDPDISLILNQLDIILDAIFNHGFWPDAALDLTNMGLSEIVHAKPGLANTSANGKWQFAS